MSFDNIILATDSYKITHHYQYPNNTELVYSYFESRGGKFSEVVLFGLQYLIKKWLVGNVVTQEKIDEAKELFHLHFGHDFFNEEGWLYILKTHNGQLPIRIKAVPEGIPIPVKNVLFTVENTDPKCYWLTNYIETLLVEVWYPTTVATLSREMKKILKSYLVRTSNDIGDLPFKLHDFGFRGASSVESAGIGGAGHLVNFLGTDNIASLVVLRNYYNEKIAGFSIPATEHSTITTWKESGELEAIKNMIASFPGCMTACVIDSYDIWQVCSQYLGTDLRDDVERRKFPFVIRPDSGDPTKIVPKVLDVLGKQFGYTVNEKDFKILPKYIRIIQGDGIDFDSLEGICQSIEKAGWSLNNVTFGCGGGLLQKHNRDTQKFAYKCSFAIVDGQPRNVFKNPITDPGKQSKKGKLTLEKSGNNYITVQEGKGDQKKDILKTVFENGKLLIDLNLADIRRNAEVH